MVILDLKSTKPIYEQIMEQIKYQVIQGHLKPGDAIPSVRKLALELKITPGTVAKAYQELERQEIIETIRGKGTFIAGELVLKADEGRLIQIRKALRPQLLELTLMGYGEKEIVAFIKEICKEMSIC